MPVRHAVIAACMLFLAPSFTWAGTSFDVAPTTLDLASGKAGMFYVTNHGAKPVTVQLQPMDWRQDATGDVRTPSKTLLVSPQFVNIAPGARQSVRVLAKSEGPGEQAYRLMVSELPDNDEVLNGVRVLMQFSVPVFVNHDEKAGSALEWETRNETGKTALIAHNQGSQTVKLTRFALNGIPQGGAGFYYILPGVSREFPAPLPEKTLHITARDERNGKDIGAVAAAH